MRANDRVINTDKVWSGRVQRKIGVFAEINVGTGIPRVIFMSNYEFCGKRNCYVNKRG